MVFRLTRCSEAIFPPLNSVTPHFGLRARATWSSHLYALDTVLLRSKSPSEVCSDFFSRAWENVRMLSFVKRGLPSRRDVPAIENFSEAEIATRGRQPDRPLNYAPWRKVCFKATQEAGSKMVCRTTINGRWDTGQIALRVDLIEREGDPVARLQIFVTPGLFLQPGIKLTVDQASPMQIPYVICLANGCVAGSVANAGLIHDLESGQMLTLETVNSNVVGVR